MFLFFFCFSQMFPLADDRNPYYRVSLFPLAWLLKIVKTQNPFIDIIAKIIKIYDKYTFEEFTTLSRKSLNLQIRYDI